MICFWNMIQQFLMFLVVLGFSFRISKKVSCSIINSYNLTVTPSVLVGKSQKEIELDHYLTSFAFTDFLQTFGKSYSDIVRPTEIGKSTFGKTIWAVQISRNVQEERKLLKPMFKYVANINGDETVGYGLMVSLIQYLVYSDGFDEDITRMLDTTDIWIVPTLNPDRLYSSGQDYNNTLRSPKHSSNGLHVELDQDFPETSLEDTWPYQQETQSMMDFIKKNPFVLSGNLQGGAIVASYPFDNADCSEENGVVSLTSDKNTLEKLAKDYTHLNPMMAAGNECNKYFPDGITDRNCWNKKRGSMQDANYFLSNCFEITLHLSCGKWVPPPDLPLYWAANLPSMINFIRSIHQGIFGLVKDEGDNPIKGALVEVKGKHKSIKTTQNGEYWRLLVPGSYDVTVRAPPTFMENTKQVDLTKEPYVQLDFVLARRSIHGTIVNDDNRKPVQGGIIKASPLEGKKHVSYDIRVQQDGTFGMMLSPGKYTVTASAPSCTSKMTDIVIEQEPIQLDFLLIRQGVFGTVVGSGGMSVKEASIKVFKVQTMVNRTGREGSLVTKVTVDENGEYWLRLKDSSYSLYAAAPGFTDDHADVILKELKRSVNLNFYIMYEGSFHGVFGYVTNEKGIPVKRAVVIIRKKGQEKDIVVKTDARGKYKRMLYIGYYQIIASAPGYITEVQKKVYVREYYDVGVNFRLRPKKRKKIF